MESTQPTGTSHRHRLSARPGRGRRPWPHPGVAKLDVSRPGRQQVSGGYVDQQEAARLSGCSKDTIARARQAGRLPHARLRDRRWVIPLDDLVAAGLCAPEQDSARFGSDAGPGDADGSPGSPSVELARALVRVGALEDLVARQDDELRFLRRLALDTLGARSEH